MPASHKRGCGPSECSRRRETYSATGDMFRSRLPRSVRVPGLHAPNPGTRPSLSHAPCLPYLEGAGRGPGLMSGNRAVFGLSDQCLHRSSPVRPHGPPPAPPTPFGHRTVAGFDPLTEQNRSAIGSTWASRPVSSVRSHSGTRVHQVRARRPTTACHFGDLGLRYGNPDTPHAFTDNGPRERPGSCTDRAPLRGPDVREDAETLVPQAFWTVPYLPEARVSYAHSLSQAQRLRYLGTYLG
jgi:hypothetical protein